MTSMAVKILVLICVNLAMTGVLTSAMTYVANGSFEGFLASLTPTWLLVAFIATYQVLGFGMSFWETWHATLRAGLPIGIALSLIGTSFLKPRIERFLAS